MSSMSPHSRAAEQQGAATLLVVMVLFFVMALVAAYSSRNIIFEQKTSANQYIATSALEAADAGLEWTVSMLNGPRVTDACVPSTVTTDTSFRQRYLTMDASSGLITVGAAVKNGPLWATCWFDRASAAWVCHCPEDAAAPGTVASTPTDAYAPSFRVRFVQLNDPAPPNRSTVVRVEVMGCNRFDDACLTFPAPHPTQCGGTVCAMLALYSGVKSPPTAALTAKGGVDVGGAALGAYNTGAGTSGLSVVSGGAVNSVGMDLRGPPGTPASRTWLQNAAGLSDAAFTDERMFAAVFGAWPATYVEQQAAVRVDCSATCNATTVRDAVSLNPGHVFLLNGDVTLDGGADIGSAADPVVLVVAGNLQFSAPTDIYGLVYVRAANWATSGADGQIFGATVAQGQISGSGAFKSVYQKDILNTLRWATGSFVKVPGGWRDYQ
jgi:hypothetical protein